jgi:transposase-like protein
MSSGKREVEKARYWRRVIREATQSGMSIRGFCRQHRLKESQFYWWQHKLKAGRQERMRTPGGNRAEASFALVSDEPEATDAGIELVLGDGRQLRIRLISALLNFSTLLPSKSRNGFRERLQASKQTFGWWCDGSGRFV